MKDLIQELEESKRVVGKMKEADEHGILELTGGMKRQVQKALEGGGEAQLGLGGESC